MDAKKKCSVCGCESLIPMRFGTIDGEPGVFFVPTVESFACTKCGHMEFYARKEDIQNYLDKQELARKDAEKREAALKEIAKAREERERLLSITEDEEQTLRAIKKAREELVAVNARIRELETILR